jgi:flagellar biosynthetic protein FliQ
VSEDQVLNMGMDAIVVALKVALPVLLVGLLVGFAVSIFQAVTQIQEMTLTFIPKILAMVAVIVVAGPWMLDQILSYTAELWGSIPVEAGPS